MPAGFEPLADALRYNGAVIAAAHEIGRLAAGDGASLDDVLTDVALTYQCVSRRRRAGFEVVRAVSTAWADASLRFLHAVSCEDPLTGLASLAHVRSKILEIYREQTRRGEHRTASHALVVVELDRVLGPGLALRPDAPARRHRRDACGTVYAGDETIGRLTRVARRRRRTPRRPPRERA